jgi:hypothetical protein
MYFAILLLERQFSMTNATKNRANNTAYSTRNADCTISQVMTSDDTVRISSTTILRYYCYLKNLKQRPISRYTTRKYKLASFVAYLLFNLIHNSIHLVGELR